MGTTCAWPHCRHFNKRFVPNTYRVSIEPEKNLALDIVPYQPVAELAIVRASPTGKGNLRGRGHKNIIWIHLECSEQCIAFLNSNTSHFDSIIIFDFALSSFTNRIHHEERGCVDSAHDFHLDAPSISALNQWQTGKAGQELSAMLYPANVSEEESEEKVHMTSS